MKLVLMGYMASGKSAVGKLLAKKLAYNFIDLDAYIESKEQRSISKIFDAKGEIYFRQKETIYLTELLNSNENFVLSTGGGTPCYANNMDLISNLSDSFYLKSSINTLTHRLISEKGTRPLVATLKDNQLHEFIGKHLFERTPYYQRAQMTIITDNNSINEVVDLILESQSK